jgi:hypothetical protein
MSQVEAILHHLLVSIGTTFRHVAIAFGATFLAGAAVIEAVAALLTKQFPPASLTHVVAAILALSLAFNAALVVAFQEGIRDFIQLLGDVAKSTEEAATKAVQGVEKAGDELLHAGEHGAQSVAHAIDKPHAA